MASDAFEGYALSPAGPYRRGAAVTPSDDTDLDEVPTALYVGVTGDVTCILVDDADAVTLKSVPVGILPVRVSRVLATGTTATNMVALY